MSTRTGQDYTVRFERWPWESSPGLGGRFSAALVAAFLVLAPYLANSVRDYTRYCTFWRTSDTLLVGVLLIGVAITATLAGEAVRVCGRPRVSRAFNHLFLIVIGASVLNNIAFMLPKLPYVHRNLTTVQIQTGWIVLAGLVGYSLGRPQWRLVQYCRRGCQVLVPVVPITFASMLWNATYPVNVEPILPVPQPCSVTTPVGASSRQAAGLAHGGVYVFLFDEWSYERTFSGGRVLPGYPHLAEFAARATTYHDAHAPGECTEQSMPGIFLQTAEPVEVHAGQLGFGALPGGFVPASERTSIFSRMKPLGYRTAMIGSVLPYRLWLGNQVDLCRSYCFYPRVNDWAGQLGMHALNAARYFCDPWSLKAYETVEQRIVNATTCHMIGNVRHDVRTIVREWPTETFLFAHVFLPHLPVVLNADLTFRTPEQTGWTNGDLDQYESNLRAMDALLGDFLATLRQSGRYEDAVVVLTADHNWRDDPDWNAGRLTGRRDHVPLLVKAPRQDRPHAIAERFETKDLGDLIERVANRPLPEETLFTENRAR